MCGFYAEFFKDKKYRNDLNLKTKKILSHRGPDQKGSIKSDLFNLYFWRLSIVDDKLGKQPMVDKENEIIVLFNGEIYNYIDLRKQTSVSHQYKTKSDTEVIIGSYKKWGNACFNHFEGMFSIAIIDLKKKKLILSRDICGVKPLYYILDKNNLKIGSEPKVFFENTNNKKKINTDSLYRYILYQSINTQSTLYQNIDKLLPGQIIIYNLKSLKKINQDNIIIKKPKLIKSKKDYFKNVQSTICNAVKLSTQSPLVQAFHLSGGLDSNILISLTKKFFNKKKIFTYSSLIDNKNDLEFKFINEASSHYNSKHKNLILNKDNFFKLYDEAIYYLDEPVGDPGVVAQFLVNKEISKKFKIVVSGQGSDEFFMGYMRNYIFYIKRKYNLDKMSNINNSKVHAKVLNFLNDWKIFLKKNDSTKNLYNGYFNNLSRVNFEEDKNFYKIKNLLNNIFKKDLLKNKKLSSNFLNFMIFSELKIQLPSLLHMEDRASMAYSVESRVPFCTNSILGLSLSGKENWIFDGFLPKGILRSIFKKNLPKIIINRNKKVGRPVPFKKWLFENKVEMRDFYKSKNSINGIFQKNIFHDILENENPYDRTLWGAWTIHKFLKKHDIKVS
tara:strand:+ start:486 stop:2327 length:1842 start_codon:yes stop_codon:yes gene_type:complete